MSVTAFEAHCPDHAAALEAPWYDTNGLPEGVR
jgi:hypothetical protein